MRKLYAQFILDSIAIIDGLKIQLGLLDAMYGRRYGIQELLLLVTRVTLKSVILILGRKKIGKPKSMLEVQSAINLNQLIFQYTIAIKLLSNLNELIIKQHFFQYTIAIKLLSNLNELIIKQHFFQMFFLENMLLTYLTVRK